MMLRTLSISPLAFSLLILLTARNIAQDVEFASSNLPIVVLTTDGTPIPDEPKVPAQMGIIRTEGQRNFLTDPFTDYHGPITIELRGNSSLDYLQKQYLFKTVHESGDEVNVSLMDFPSEHEWILYAPYADKSLIRNTITYEIAREMGRYASRTRFCELVIDGRYEGVYALQESIKRDRNRVNIGKMTPDDEVGDAVTGGYILSIDHSVKPWDKGFAATFDHTGYFTYWFVYPTSKKITPVQEDYIRTFIGTFDDAMRRPDFFHPTRGYQSMIDADSFVDYILINELANNVDGYTASLHLHKDRNSRGGKLKAGPVWDFNIAYGNAWFNGGTWTSGWRIHMGRIPYWWRVLLTDTAFVNRLQNRWYSLRQSTLSDARINSRIDSLALHLDEAKDRHFQRWLLLGQYVWPNAFAGETYVEEIDYLKTWLRDRLAWIDENLPSIGTVESDIMMSANEPPHDDAVILSVHPYPSSGTVFTEYRLAKDAYVQIILQDMLGREVLRLPAEYRRVGIQRVSLQMNHLPSGPYTALLLIDRKIVDTERVILSK